MATPVVGTPDYIAGYISDVLKQARAVDAALVANKARCPNYASIYREWSGAYVPFLVWVQMLPFNPNEIVGYSQTAVVFADALASMKTKIATLCRINVPNMPIRSTVQGTNTIRDAARDTVASVSASVQQTVNATLDQVQQRAQAVAGGAVTNAAQQLQAEREAALQAAEDKLIKWALWGSAGVVTLAVVGALIYSATKAKR